MNKKQKEFIKDVVWWFENQLCVPALGTISGFGAYFMYFVFIDRKVWDAMLFGMFVSGLMSITMFHLGQEVEKWKNQQK